MLPQRRRHCCEEAHESGSSHYERTRRAKGPKCNLLTSKDKMAVGVGFIPPFHHPREKLQGSEGSWCLHWKKGNM